MSASCSAVDAEWGGPYAHTQPGGDIGCSLRERRWPSERQCMRQGARTVEQRSASPHRRNHWVPPTKSAAPATRRRGRSYVRELGSVRIARLVGHSSTSVTETVYRKQLGPVIETGAVAMDEIFEP